MYYQIIYVLDAWHHLQHSCPYEEPIRQHSQGGRL